MKKHFSLLLVTAVLLASNVFISCEAAKENAGTDAVPPATEGGTPADTTAPAQTPEGALYVCPMHPDVTSDKPGNCSKCGMPLEKKS